MNAPSETSQHATITSLSSMSALQHQHRQRTLLHVPVHKYSHAVLPCPGLGMAGRHGLRLQTQCHAAPPHSDDSPLTKKTLHQ